MVDAAAGTGRKTNDWGFHEEPPPSPMTTGTSGSRPALGWGNVDRLVPTERPNVAHPLLLDVSAFSAAGLTHATAKPPRFPDTPSLGAEILRLKQAGASTQEIIMRQAEWVSMAKREGRQEPTGPLDPLRATPAEVANALLWSEAGGVIPRDALAHDGGRAFTESVRDAVVLRTRGFDAMLALHDGEPAKQRALLTQELGLRGVQVPANASLDALGALYRTSLREEDSLRPTIGLDGQAGTSDEIDAYERDQVIAAMNPGTTLGSLMATGATIVTGTIDIERMRAMGNAGDAVEGILGGAGVHMNEVTVERENQFVPKKNLDDFNRTGLKPRFEVTKI